MINRVNTGLERREIPEGGAAGRAPGRGYYLNRIQPVTMFTSLPGTTMTPRIVLPAMEALTLNPRIRL